MLLGIKLYARPRDPTRENGPGGETHAEPDGTHLARRFGLIRAELAQIRQSGTLTSQLLSYLYGDTSGRNVNAEERRAN